MITRMNESKTQNSILNEIVNVNLLVQNVI